MDLSPCIQLSHPLDHFWYGPRDVAIVPRLKSQDLKLAVRLLRTIAVELNDIHQPCPFFKGFTLCKRLRRMTSTF